MPNGQEGNATILENGIVTQRSTGPESSRVEPDDSISEATSYPRLEPLLHWEDLAGHPRKCSRVSTQALIRKTGPVIDETE